MLWPRTGRHLAAEQARHFADVRRNNPESETWLALVEAALVESQDAATWRVAIPATDGASRPARAPRLHDAEIAVHPRSASRFVRRLAKLAGMDGAARHIDAMDLLEAAICQDDARVDAGTPKGADPATVRVVAQMAALPLLRACAQIIGTAAAPAWSEGYCPVCGAWPTLAEFRGLERKRWLRCGRCGTGWEVPWLRCPFCAETSHENLGYLAPDGEAETTRKVEVCDTCKGYVKAEPSVTELPWWRVLLDDVATVPLDVAALDRGYHRPERPGFALEARIVKA